MSELYCEQCDEDLASGHASWCPIGKAERGEGKRGPVTNLNGWSVWDSFVQIPVDTPYLVYLAEPMAGSLVHVATDHRVANGTVCVIGSVLASEAPDILLYRPMVPLPERE